MPAGVIGVDESGKGDFFGPLVVAGVAVEEDALASLIAIGVRDSKTLVASRIDSMAEAILKQFPSFVLVVTPEEYNKSYQSVKNLNKLLATGHASVIEQLARHTQFTQAISDKFGKPELIDNELHRRGVQVELRQLIRGEQFPQVAAASILARSRFVVEMAKLSSEWGLELPKGAAAHVDQAGRAFVKKFGVEDLRKVAKLHFKNYQRATA